MAYTYPMSTAYMYSEGAAYTFFENMGMGKLMARVGVNLPGPEGVKAGLEVARAMTKYYSNLFLVMERDWKAEILVASVVGHGDSTEEFGVTELD